MAAAGTTLPAAGMLLLVMASLSVAVSESYNVWSTEKPLLNGRKRRSRELCLTHLCVAALFVTRPAPL